MAPRLLIVADSKMLPALANGLREGGNFDVQAVPLSDRQMAQAAVDNADLVAVFYGAPGAPLAAALQALAPKVRERGGRLVAVLQREQAAQRDDCFRAGASDLLFMPMPKDQFVARLQGSLGLSWAAENGTTAPVAIATRAAASRLEQAKVSPSGVEAPAELPVKAGDTVRLSWGAFQTWGLVVRGAPSAQIRFAGLAPDEEAQIREWLKSGSRSAPPRAQAPTAPTLPASTPAPGGRAAPAAGPPPGFAGRTSTRPQTTPARPVPRVPPPVTSSPGAPAPARPPPAPARAAAPAADGALAGLFDEGAAAPAPSGGGAVPQPVPTGPPWPTAVSIAACKSAAMQLVRDKTLPGDLPVAVAASARKITGVLSTAERTALEKGDPESPFADAIGARIALEAATSEGVKLYSSAGAPNVDGTAVAVLTKGADEAAAGLQKAANAALGKGKVESLQMVTASSAALSRELLNFKEMADRLRGVGAAPRMGAGALDPEVVLPGQQPRPKPLPSTTQAPVRAELRDFRALDQKPGRGKNVLLLIALIVLLVAGGNALWFGVPQIRTVTQPEDLGRGVVRVDVSGTSAMVTVTQEWAARAEQEIPRLVNALRTRGVQKAILMLPNGTAAGMVDVTTGKATGLLKPKPPEPPK